MTQGLGILDFALEILEFLVNSLGNSRIYLRILEFVLGILEFLRQNLKSRLGSTAKQRHKITAIKHLAFYASGRFDIASDLLGAVLCHRRY